MRRPLVQSRAVLGVAVVALALTASACSDPEYAGGGEWQSQMNMPGPQVQPQPEAPDPSAPSGSEATQPEADDPAVMAVGLDEPVGIAPLPDGTALVGERKSGKVFKVYPDGITPKQELLTIPGLDASGDGGLLGIAASASFVQDGLVYAYITTATDNRVVSFTLAGAVVPLLTAIPRGATHNGGALSVGPDGLLYVATGDAGDSQAAKDNASLAGKVLRVDEFGDPPQGGSGAPSDLVLARGLTNPTGLCLSAQAAYVVDSGSGTMGKSADDAIYTLQPGANYASGQPLIDYGAESDPTGAYGCAAVATSPVVTMLDGKAIWASVLDKNGEAAADPQKALIGKYGRLRGIALDPLSGNLWISTSNRDAAGTPIEEDDRVILVPSPIGGGGGGIT